MAIPQRIAATWKNRHPRLRRWVVAVFCIFVVVGFCIWASAHRHDPDIDLKLTNFLAAFWPFAISVFAAFIPDLEKIDKMRPIWRIGIVAAGLMYSLILWHQQSVALDSSRHDQEHI